VYLGAVVVLLSAMTQGLTGRRAARLRALVGVDRRTLERWRRWWRETFATTAVWKVLRGRWVVAPATAELPAALLERVVGGLDRQVLSLLMWLVPLTTSTCSMMVDLDPQRMLVAWSERGR
jgi:membrane protein required for beta-lactamase induction